MTGRNGQGKQVASGVASALVLLALTACSHEQSNRAFANVASVVVAAPPVAVGGVLPPNPDLTALQIPIPLPSPRHRSALEVRVASINPTQSLASLRDNMSASQLAGVYLRYDTALGTAESSHLNTPKEVRRVLQNLRFDTPDGMALGWYTVQATLAAENSAFTKGVQAEVAAKGHDQVLSLLNNGGDYVSEIPGAGEAAQTVIASVTAEDARMARLSSRFIDVAHKFQQKKKWGMNVPLSQQVPTQYASASEGLLARFKAVLTALSPITPAEAYTPNVMNHILTLGARQIITSSTTGSPATASDRETAHCLTWARLNFNQCIAAAHFPSEEAWCTGKHAIDEVRSCWAVVLPAATTMQP